MLKFIRGFYPREGRYVVVVAVVTIRTIIILIVIVGVVVVVVETTYPDLTPDLTPPRGRVGVCQRELLYLPKSWFWGRVSV